MILNIKNKYKIVEKQTSKGKIFFELYLGLPTIIPFVRDWQFVSGFDLYTDAYKKLCEIESYPEIIDTIYFKGTTPI